MPLRLPARFLRPLVLGLALGLAVLPPPAHAEAVPPAFRQAVAEAAAEDAAVADFYRGRDYAPVWTVPAGVERLRALLAVLERAGDHGLPVARYDAAALAAAVRGMASERDRGQVEVRLTRALLDYARDIQTGALVPARVDAGIVREVPVRDRAALLADFLAADPAAFLRALPPASQEYARLMRAKRMLEQAAATGAWGSVVPGAGLRPGQTGAAVLALRNRLMAMGYLPRSAAASYDAALLRAVAAFQAAHGITPDGVADAATLAEINRPPEARLKSVLVAMERERWSNFPRGDRHIWVNLTDFTAKIVDHGKVTFETRAVIGSEQADKRTPEFSDHMTYMEVNPDWTVPRGIIRRDYLPKLQANPGALGHLQVIDSRGRVVPRGQVNFARYTAANFPFSLRQPPGQGNALGQVKFMFPNPWSIYLHDTPDKHLFGREMRAYSSGCVRLGDPFQFAYALLARQEADPRAAFHAVLDSGRQTRIFLDEPVPIHIDYRTAFTTPRGALEFRRDIYGRDAAIFAALERAGVVPVAPRG